MPFITLNIGSTMNGSRMCTIAMYTPMRLRTSCTGSSQTPSVMARSLTSASFCSSTSQAVVRTSNDVQNGSSSRRINRLLCLVGRTANR